MKHNTNTVALGMDGFTHAKTMHKSGLFVSSRAKGLQKHNHSIS